MSSSIHAPIKAAPRRAPKASGCDDASSVDTFVVVELFLMMGQAVARALTYAITNLRVGYVATCGEAALDVVRLYRPALMIADLEAMPLNVNSFVAAVRDGSAATKLIIHTRTNSLHRLAPAFAAKPDGFVHKSEPIDILHQAVRAVTKGQTFYSPLAAALMTQCLDPLQIKRNLSADERSLLRLITAGYSSKEIAELLFRSRKAIENQRSRLMQKLGIERLPCLVEFAIEHGLGVVDPSPDAAAK